MQDDSNDLPGQEEYYLDQVLICAFEKRKMFQTQTSKVIHGSLWANETKPIKPPLPEQPCSFLEYKHCSDLYINGYKVEWQFCKLIKNWKPNSNVFWFSVWLDVGSREICFCFFFFNLSMTQFSYQIEIMLDLVPQIRVWSMYHHPVLDRASLVAQTIRNLLAMQETLVWSLGWEDRLEEGMATNSSTLAWRIPWTEEPGGLQSMGSQRVS